MKTQQKDTLTLINVNREQRRINKVKYLYSLRIALKENTKDEVKETLNKYLKERAF